MGVVSLQCVEDIAVGEISKQSVLGVYTIAVVFDDVLDQQMLVCIDEALEVTTLPSEAADFANWEEFGDVHE